MEEITLEEQERLLKMLDDMELDKQNKQATSKINDFRTFFNVNEIAFLGYIDSEDTIESSGYWMIFNSGVTYKITYNMFNSMANGITKDLEDLGDLTSVS